jgi:hypothetical protein
MLAISGNNHLKSRIISFRTRNIFNVISMSWRNAAFQGDFDAQKALDRATTIIFHVKWENGK